MSVPFLSFLSDYGLEDEFVGVCHGVIARRCPCARVIDLTHAIPRGDVLAGALTLRDALRFMPAGVHLAVVDPGVGATGAQARRALALRTAERGDLLVGPDNGLLTPAAEALGGVVEAVEIGGSRERLQPVSATFHGRDLFAPVAAALADGVPLAGLGESLDPASLRRLDLPRAEISGGALHAHVLGVDRFGNLALDATAQQLEQIGATARSRLVVEAAPGPAGGSDVTERSRLAIDAAESRVAKGDGGALVQRGRAFADVPAGELLLYEDARGMLAVAVNLGSAADRLRLGRGGELALRLA